MTSSSPPTDTFDEFSYLPAQADELGLTAPPPPERVALSLPDGRRLSALRWPGADGSGSPSVTFLHGAGLNAHTWDTTLLALGAPALAIDLAGHGDSTWRGDVDYRPATLAPDVTAALEAWTERPQVLVGQSLGGVTAALVAARHPDLVRRLVVVDITPGVDPNEGPTQIREFFSGPTDWADRDELVERALAFGLGGNRTQTERGVFLNSRVRADGRVEWKHHFAHLAAQLAGAPDAAAPAPSALGDPEEGWSALRAAPGPVTLVRGDHGYVSDADAEEFSRRLPDAAVRMLPSTHNVQEVVPRELAGIVRSVL